MESTSVIKKKEITPEAAQKVLQAQQPGWNRRISQADVDYLVNEIETGAWREDSGKIILVKENGRLIDGQHRLSAVVRANKPVTVWVQWVDTEAEGLEIMRTLDCGRGRSLLEKLRLLGHNPTGIEKATVSLLALFEDIGDTTSTPKRVTERAPKLNTQEFEDLQAKYEPQLTMVKEGLTVFKAACVYAPLAYAAVKYPRQTKSAIEFLEVGQKTELLNDTWVSARNGLLRQQLGGGQPRGEAILLVFNLVKALVLGKGGPNRNAIKSTAENHTDLIRFFSFTNTGASPAFRIIKKAT